MTATVKEMHLTLLIPIVCVAPWVLGIAVTLWNSGLNLGAPLPSYIERAEQRLAAR